MKKTIFIILIFVLTTLLFTSVPLSVNAHSGRTDSNGGHTDKDTGEYHYHHGYPAHDHYDMDGDGDLDCPYDFDDKTDHNPDSNGDSNFDWDFDNLTVPTLNTDIFTLPDLVNNSVIQREEQESDSDVENIVIGIVAFVLIGGFWIAPIFFGKK